jgi:DNA-binding SARP family transcriptional activator
VTGVWPLALYIEMRIGVAALCCSFEMTRAREALGMEFLVLGPLLVRSDGRPVPVGGRRTEVLLAMLLEDAGRVVSVDALIEAAWDGTSPSTATKQVQNRIAALRRILVAAGAGPDVITVGARGYTLNVTPDQIDSHRFASAVERGRARARAGSPTDGIDTMRSALALWRGLPYAGIDSRAVRTAATRLVEQRLNAQEECIELELAAGHHREVLDELAELVGRHPFRERIVGHWMLALYRCGRQADALAAYRVHRKLLVTEHGIEPDGKLQQLHRAILNRDQDLDAAAGPHQSVIDVPAPRPAQLPPGLATFTGREPALRDLAELIDNPARGRGLVVLTGSAGVGKTALAVHWGHAVADRFPDGQLFVNLHGYSFDTPREPAEALGHLLAGLGVTPDRLPVGCDERAALYRSLLTGRRVLVLLDNARTADQVRPLLPGDPGCVTVVTSRDTLTGLTVTDDARLLALDVFSRDEALTLIGQMLGEAGIDHGPRLAQGLAEACAYLPLALRIAIAHICTHPRRTPADLVEKLTATGPLAQLTIAGESRLAVRAAFDLSYNALDDERRRAFRHLGTLHGADFTAPVLAALSQRTVAEAQRSLDLLASAHLVQPAGRAHSATDVNGDGSDGRRYTFHDLLREYAALRMAADDADEQGAARDRLLRFYLSTADEVGQLAYPRTSRLPRDPAATSLPSLTFAAADAGLAWLDAEVDNIVAECLHDFDTEPSAVLWLLADSLHGYFWVRRHRTPWLSVLEGALSMAKRAGEPTAEIILLNHLGTAHWMLSEPTLALVSYEAALALSREGNDRLIEGGVLSNLGSLYHELGRLELARRHTLEAIELHRKLDWPLGQANCHITLSALNRDLGHIGEARNCAVHALDIYQRLSLPLGICSAEMYLADAALALGDYAACEAHARAALLPGDAVGSAVKDADALELIARAEFGRGRFAAGLNVLTDAATAAQDSDDAQLEAAIANAHAEGHLGLRNFVAAERWCRRAAQLAGRANKRLYEIEALIILATVLTRSGRARLAMPEAERALALARSAQMRLREAVALEALAECHTDLGQPVSADRYWYEAANIWHETGCRPRQPLGTAGRPRPASTPQPVTGP